LTSAERRELHAILAKVVKRGWEYDHQWDDATRREVALFLIKPGVLATGIAGHA
jgi:hypothetical protein